MIPDRHLKSKSKINWQHHGHIEEEQQTNNSTQDKT